MFWENAAKPRSPFEASVVNDGPNRFASMHEVEGFVDSRERPCVGDKRSELYFFCHCALHHSCQVGAPFDTTKSCPELATAGNELERARAEAVENAVKIARGYTNRPGVIAFHGGFHGRTLLGMSLTGMSAPYKQNFGPFAPDVYHAPYPNAYHGITPEDALKALQTIFSTQIQPDRVAAVILEPVQGDGGFLAAPPEFMRALRKLTSQHGIVLICDAIQTGFGRTGKMFGFQHSEIQPDLVTVAKSLAGGMPISGVVGRAEIIDAPTPGGLGGTYGGNPLACAAANAVLDIFEKENLLERSSKIGEKLRVGLEALTATHPQMGEIRQIGAMVAVEFVADPETKAPDSALVQRVLDAAREEGLLLIKCAVERNVVRFLSPLTISDQDIADALAMFGRALASLQS
jgi:4-aminobutyrate aminotransferase / (S)-3-amino-2-methylpropionate transaminase / 5-aminovalerate transaminase